MVLSQVIDNTHEATLLWASFNLSMCSLRSAVTIIGTAVADGLSIAYLISQATMRIPTLPSQEESYSIDCYRFWA